MTSDRMVLTGEPRASDWPMQREGPYKLHMIQPRTIIPNMLNKEQEAESAPQPLVHLCKRDGAEIFEGCGGRCGGGVCGWSGQTPPQLRTNDRPHETAKPEATLELMPH